MRVIAGQCKGKVLYSPKSKLIRPTSDRVKEDIFNYISDSVVGARVLDLFAGTANLSIEALSRGADSAVLVDWSKEAIKLIDRNLEITRFKNKCQVVRSDITRFLNYAEREEHKYGLIFADPPYSGADAFYQKLIQKIDSGSILVAGGLFVFEHDSKVKLDLELSSLKIKTTKILGDTAITIFFQREA
ncbi:16S rRNA (guanine(966)-N(2))-methyltransferase RsmD [candidate division KSB1 bacterium 4572_119]|nr:MAG: 16S rRNA (guanine(966)-N(2))-methyltransferase RsmD [candidate division KSB1 bacterium 4572_119]